MGKYTNEEDRRERLSLIIRTLLGIAVTFGLLCWYSGGLPGGAGNIFVPDDLFKNIIPAVILAAVIFILTRQYFSSVAMWKILLLNFCLGNVLFWLDPLLGVLVSLIGFAFSVRINSPLPLLSLELIMVTAANLTLYLKCSKGDNAARPLPASIGVYLLALICFFSPLLFMVFFIFSYL